MLLRARSFTAVTTQEAGLPGRSDAEQLEFAVAQQKVLLAHNRADFEALARDYFSTNRKHHGIVIAVRRSPHEIVARLLLVLNSVTADEMENQLRYI